MALQSYYLPLRCGISLPGRLVKENAMAIEDKFLKLFHASPEAILVTELANGKIVEVNDHFVNFSGFTRDELLGHSVLDLEMYDFEGRNKFISLLNNHGSFSDIEFTLTNKSRKTFPVLASAELIEISGKPHAITVLQDITERKQKEIQDKLYLDILTILNGSDELPVKIHQVLTLIKEFSGFEAVGIRLHEGDDYPYYETQGFPDKHISLENRLCAYSTSGKLLRDQNGNPVLECMCGNIICGRVDPNQPFFTKGGSFWTNSTNALLASTTEEDRQARTRNRCNGEGYESVALIPFRSQQGNIGLLQLNDSRSNMFNPDLISFYEKLALAIGNVLARVKTEEENRKLRYKNEIASRLASVGEMAAGIAHEINNPLTPVLGLSDYLARRTDLPEDIRQDLHVIADGAKRAGDIIRRMLVFAGQSTPKKMRVDINELVLATLALRDYVHTTANIEVVKNLDSKIPQIVTDPAQIQQIFVNIIVNAEYSMKKAHGKGKLIVSTERAGNQARISFQDDGLGVNKTIAKQLFDPFFTTKAVGEGTGLGLSLSRAMVEELGGTIEFVTEHQGATFTVVLPLSSSSDEMEEKPPGDSPKPKITKPGRILVVDDEEMIRKVIERVLTVNGCSVETTASGMDALSKLEKKDYDCVLLDLRLPGMSGIEVYREIKENHTKYKNKVIIITGDIADHGTDEFLINNKLTSIRKPFDIDTLVRRVNELL